MTERETRLLERRKAFEQDVQKNVPQKVLEYIETISKNIYIFRNNGQDKAMEHYKCLLRGVIRCLDVQGTISLTQGRRLWEYYANHKTW